MGNRTPTLGEIVMGHIDVALEQLRVAQPGRIESYDPVTGRAEVTPLLKRPVHLEDGSVSWISLPRTHGVPVALPRAGGRRIKLPVAKGDVVLLVFCDFALDEWKAGQGVGDPNGIVQPGTLGTHQLADAIAIPCLWDPVGAPAHDSIELLADGTVLLGEGATQGVGLGHALRTELDALWNAIFGGHTHPVTAAPGTTGPAVGVAAKQTVESAIVKAA